MHQLSVTRWRCRAAATALCFVSLAFAASAALAADLLVSSSSMNTVKRYDGNSGAFVGNFISSVSGARDLTFGPDGNLYVSIELNGAPGYVRRYDGHTGAFLGTFVTAGSGNLRLARGLRFGPDGNLYVISLVDDRYPGRTIKRYDGVTGAYLGDFVTADSGGLISCYHIEFGPDGDLYVNNGLSLETRQVSCIKRYDGQTGEYLGNFVPPGSGGMIYAQSFTFGPDGDLYVGSPADNYGGGGKILRYDGTTGSFLGVVVAPNTPDSPDGPLDIRFGPDGHLYVASSLDNTIKRYHGITGAYLGNFVTPGSGGLYYPQSIVFEPVPPNSPPTLTIDNGNVTVDEGQLAVNAGTWFDPDGDSVSAVASVGSVIAYPDGSWVWTYQTTSGPEQSQIVTITIDDGRGGTAEASFELVVRDVPPPDLLPPDITVARPVHGATYPLGSWLVPDFGATDEQSGVAFVTAVLNGTQVSVGQTVQLTQEGPNSLVVTAADNAGNVSTVEVPFTVVPFLEQLGPARLWIGLKNSDDVGTSFDLKAEVYINGSLIGEGILTEFYGGSSGFNNARLAAIPLELTGPVVAGSGDVISIRALVRISALSRHRSGTARLWFNDAAANSRYDTVRAGEPTSYYLLDGFVLGTAPGPGPKKTLDVKVDRAVGGNPFKPFGEWTFTIP